MISFFTVIKIEYLKFSLDGFCFVLFKNNLVFFYQIYLRNKDMTFQS